MKDIAERLNCIYDKIMQDSFRQNKGLGNEVGFHIFDYEPEHEILVRSAIKDIKERATKHTDVKIVEFDLYEIVLEVMESKGYLKKNFDLEQRSSSEKVFDATRRVMRLTTNDDLVSKYIESKLDAADIVFITGVGKVWPILRSHTVLNNLHSVIVKQPLVMFYPGTYSGDSLMLFNQFKDDNYYRAFPLVDRY